jgi:HK97 gp10 family phage protein
MTRKKTVFFAQVALNLRTAEEAFFVNEALFDATQEVIGLDAVERARSLAPVLPKATAERVPGELRDSIDARVTRVSSGKKSGVRARITTNCGYGGWVELGTVKAAAEPFIWPAFEQAIQRLPDAVRENLATYTTGDGKKNG